MRRWERERGREGGKEGEGGGERERESVKGEKDREKALRGHLFVSVTKASS